MQESSSRSIQGRLTNCKTSLSGGEEAGDKQENRRTSTWEWQFHAVGITVPRHGTHSPTPWNSQFQSLGLAVPKPGTHGPKAWNSRSQSLELRVPKAGRQSGTLMLPNSRVVTVQTGASSRRFNPNHRKGDGQEDTTQGKRYKKNPLPCRKEQRTHINDLRDCTGKMSEAYSPWAGAAGCSAALPSAAAAGASPCAGACCSAGLTLEASKPGMPCGLV